MKARRTRRGFFAVAVVLGLGAWSLATAPVVQARSSKSAKKLARGLYKKAEVQYSLGRFKAALSLYSAAYQTLQLPGFLFNIGQCHRNLQNYRKALFFYRGFLRREKRPANRVMAQRVIQLTQRLLKEKLRRARPVDPRVVRRPRLSDPAHARRPPHHATVPDPRTTPRPGLHKRWWFWTAIAVGVATVVGVSVGLASMNRSDEPPPRGSLGTIDLRF